MHSQHGRPTIGVLLGWNLYWTPNPYGYLNPIFRGCDQISINGNARYVRVYGSVRATTCGYSLWEFGIYR